MASGFRKPSSARFHGWMTIDPEFGKSALMGEGLCPSPFLIT